MAEELDDGGRNFLLHSYHVATSDAWHVHGRIHAFRHAHHHDKPHTHDVKNGVYRTMGAYFGEKYGATVQPDPSKVERKLRDELNYIKKRLPGRGRIQTIERLADELEIEADTIKQRLRFALTDPGSRFALLDPDNRPELVATMEGLNKDAKTLRRLAFDLREVRDFSRGARKQNPRWPEEEGKRP